MMKATPRADVEPQAHCSRSIRPPLSRPGRIGRSDTTTTQMDEADEEEEAVTMAELEAVAVDTALPIGWKSHWSSLIQRPRHQLGRPELGLRCRAQPAAGREDGPSAHLHALHRHLQPRAIEQRQTRDQFPPSSSLSSCCSPPVVPFFLPSSSSDQAFSFWCWSPAPSSCAASAAALQAGSVHHRQQTEKGSSRVEIRVASDLFFDGRLSPCSPSDTHPCHSFLLFCCFPSFFS